MLKKVLPLLVFASLLLASCQPTAKSVVATPNGTPMPNCKVVSLLPAPDPNLVKLIPDVGPGDHVLGSKDAKVTILEYSDFQCPYCAELAKVIPQLVAKYPNELRVAYRHFTLAQHKNALAAAYAVEAAANQGKFFELSDVAFQNQDAWGGMTSDQVQAWMADQAKALGLDVAKFNADAASQAVKNHVEINVKQAESAQLPGTPFLFINGIPYQSNMDLTALSGVVELVRLANRQYKACPSMVIDVKKQYQATIKTEKGDIVVKLYADQAPLAVNSFVFLAQNGWFNNVTFHRVLPDFMAQGGDPSGSGFGGPGYQFANENAAAHFDRAGLLAMANSGADTNGSQFFITYANEERLDGQYTIFGEVTQGMDVAKKLTPRDPQQGGDLPTGDKILSVDISVK